MSSVSGLLRNEVLFKALSSYHLMKYNPKVKNKNLLMIVDYALPSSSKRLFVINIERKDIIRAHHVAHGKGSSDPYNPAKAIKFGNKIGSGMSSIGPAVTGNTYFGVYGRSLRLHGLSDTNSNMLVRAVVLHKSNYVTDAFINQYGYCGRSLGCLSVDPAIKDGLIDLVGNGTFIFLNGD